MNKHIKDVMPGTTDLSRRSFLVGIAATGLVLGYAGVPGIGEALAAPSSFEPSVWYAIAPDGLVTVTRPSGEIAYQTLGSKFEGAASASPMPGTPA